MEYLVTMTTQVPAGTSEQAVDDVRGREAERSRELATQGHLLRLWRPPLQPGEWRTLGLFAAEDLRQLEGILASMPLRVWRQDQVVVLSTHPNDPSSPGPRSEAPEFLTAFTITVPPDAHPESIGDVTGREARRAAALAARGHLVRLWTLPSRPGQSRALGLWQADGPSEMDEIIRSLPVGPWATVETTPLRPHPSDPGRIRAHTPGTDPAGRSRRPR